ncbi:hypothetical protein [Shewanella sp. AC91-MNA-CIBAN-0169]|uniref:hypothetical protein n=1 Tax=Shewanella sp. AC91-MNA-CIBAN-0169 TaxID=3140466 RepID=UPI0033219688
MRFKVNCETLSTVDVFAKADRLGLLQEIEQAVVCFILYKLQHIEDTRVAINIINRALHNPMFTNWLFGFTKNYIKRFHHFCMNLTSLELCFRLNQQSILLIE